MMMPKPRFAVVDCFLLCTFLCVCGWCTPSGWCSPTGSYTPSWAGASPDYATEIAPILQRHCTGCHNATEHEAGLQLHRLSSIQQGGESGPALVAGDPEASLVYRRVTGLDEPRMPPEDAPGLSENEVQLLRDWILAGAQGKDREVDLRSYWNASGRERKASEVPSISAAVRLPSGKLLIGRTGSLELWDGQQSAPVELEVIGKVTHLKLSSNGKWVLACTGIPGVGGETIVIDAVSMDTTDSVPKVIARLEGHRDIVYGAAIHPEGTLLATAGYDRLIRVWDVKSGTLARTLEGHNGAVYDLNIDRSGTLLASASADETIKLWRLDTGERLDTLGQGEAEQYAVRFDPTDTMVMAAGADRRVRVWQIMSTEKPSVSPLKKSVFVHETPVHQLVQSPDGRWIATSSEDRQIKVWDATTWELMEVLPPLDDVASAILWNEASSRLLCTTLRGTIETRDLQRESYGKNARHEGETRPRVSLSPETQSSSGEALRELEEVPGKRDPFSAQPLDAPVMVSGRLHDGDMVGSFAGDWYAFEAKGGERWVISIAAASKGSPLDSWIDVCDEKGAPVVRTRLQAVRESYFTFRGKDSTNIDDFRLHRWEDMELDEYLYAGGEVVRLWLYPRGPDSGFKVYPGFGNRITYFDTTATTHALNEPAWIVTELGADQSGVANGLPIFTVTYANDDDAARQLGKDSRLTFTAPRDGRYLVRVRDTRGQSGDAYTYQLQIKRPEPRFHFKLETTELTLRPDVGAEFSVAAERWDGMDSQIDIECVDLPEELVMTPGLSIEAYQGKAIGQLRLAEGVKEWVGKELELTFRATAKHDGREIASSSEAKMKVKVSDKPAMALKVVGAKDVPEAAPLQELRVRRGTTTTALLVIERGENQGDISFGGDDSGRNLPHGCFVDNIGLNGLLIPSGQSVREVFITASPITAPGERHFHLRAQVDGNPTTLPIRLIIE